MYEIELVCKTEGLAGRMYHIAHYRRTVMLPFIPQVGMELRDGDDFIGMLKRVTFDISTQALTAEVDPPILRGMQGWEQVG